MLPFEVVGRGRPEAHDRTGRPLALAPTVVRFATTAVTPEGTGPPVTRTVVAALVTARPVVRESSTRVGATACIPSVPAFGLAANQPTRSTTTSTEDGPFVTATAPSAPGRARTVFATGIVRA